MWNIHNVDFLHSELAILRTRKERNILQYRHVNRTAASCESLAVTWSVFGLEISRCYGHGAEQGRPD